LLVKTKASACTLRERGLLVELKEAD